MCRVWARLMLAFALVAVAPAGAAAEDEGDEWRFATLAPRGSTWMKILERGAAELEETTGQAIKFYPNGVQGDERDVIRKIRLRQLDGAAVTSIGLGMIDESIRVLELPMLFRDEDEMEYVVLKMWPYFQKRFEKEGFRLGEPGEVGWVYFMSQSKITSMAELRKAKVWLWQDDRLTREMFKKLNVSGVPMGVPWVLGGLQSGRINACYGSPLAAVALQWNTKLSYMVSMPLAYAIGGTIMRLDAWKAGSAGDRAKQTAILERTATRLRKKVRHDNKVAQRQMTKKGIQVVDTSPAMIADFEKAARETWRDLTDKLYTEEELQMVLDYRAEYRARAKK